MASKNPRFSYFFIVVMVVIALGMLLLDGDEPDRQTGDHPKLKQPVEQPGQQSRNEETDAVNANVPASKSSNR
ncbi:MAG: hypothetical protein WD002_08750 [Pseudomonadales bacterium]